MGQDRNSGKFEIQVLSVNGILKDIRDMSRTRWRLLDAPSSHPKIPFSVNNEMKVLFSETMSKDEKLDMEGRPTAPIFGESSMLSAREFMTLAYEPGMLSSSQWLEDSVIEHFARAPLDISMHSACCRVAYLDSQAIRLVESQHEESKRSLSRWLVGLNLFEVDIILWPIYDRNHWRLCIAHTVSRTVLLLDPFSPRNYRRVERRIIKKVIEGLELMSRPYSEAFEDNREWNMISTEEYCNKMNLPSQPVGNSVDCGVLVCLYMWAAITGERVPSQIHGVPTDFRNLRIVIGAYIAFYAKGCKTQM